MSSESEFVEELARDMDALREALSGSVGRVGDMDSQTAGIIGSPQHLDAIVAAASAYAEGREMEFCEFHKAAGESGLDCWGAGLDGQDSCALVPVLICNIEEGP